MDIDTLNPELSLQKARERLRKAQQGMEEAKKELIAAQTYLSQTNAVISLANSQNVHVHVPMD